MMNEEPHNEISDERPTYKFLSERWMASYSGYYRSYDENGITSLLRYATNHS